jgi:hypothetical protein
MATGFVAREGFSIMFNGMKTARLTQFAAKSAESLLMDCVGVSAVPVINKLASKKGNCLPVGTMKPSWWVQKLNPFALHRAGALETVIFM